MAFSLPNLPYPYEALEHFIDTQTMKIHHDKHHAAYVDNLNKALEGKDDLLNMDIKDLVQNLDKVPEDIRTKVRNNAGGHANHSMFWKIMAPNSKGGGGQPSGELMTAINSAYGNFASFAEKFAAAGLGRFGSGWVWVIVENGKPVIVDTPNQDTPLMEGKKAILCLDVWEHAYYLKYQNKRADYINAWWNVVNWHKVEEYFKESK